MTEFAVHGNVLNLETHLVGYGLCAVLGKGARIAYLTEGDSVSVRVSTQLSAAHAESVIAAAVRKVFSDSGVLTTDALSHATADFRSPTLSPYSSTYRDPNTLVTVKPKEGEKGEEKTVHASLDHAQVYARRSELLAGLSPVEREAAGALGKPAYWRDANQEGSTQLVYYASNSGRDLLLLNVVKHAAGMEKLSDSDLIDCISSNAHLVHNSSDWTTEDTTAVRSALAVHGLSALPTVARMGSGSVTAGVLSFKTKNINLAAHAPGYAIIPSFSVPVSVAKVRGIVSDAAWLGDTARDRAWRKEQGVVGRYAFRAVNEGAEQAETRRFSNGVPLSPTAKVSELVR